MYAFKSGVYGVKLVTREDSDGGSKTTCYLLDFSPVNTTFFSTLEEAFRAKFRYAEQDPQAEADAQRWQLFEVEFTLKLVR